MTDDLHKVRKISEKAKNKYLLTKHLREIVDKPFSYSAADSRFKAYLDESRLTPAGTLNGFRSGCAITLALTGTNLQSIMEHVGWRCQSTASYYMQLSKAICANSPSLALFQLFRIRTFLWRMGG